VGPALSQLADVAPRMVAHGADDAHLTVVLRPEEAQSLAMRLHEKLLEDAPLDDPAMAKG